MKTLVNRLRVMATEKQCRKCDVVQPISEFRLVKEPRKDRNKSPNVAYPCAWCKACERQRALARYHADRDNKMEKNKEYKQNNKDKINTTRRAYMTEKMKDHIERLKRDMKCLITSKIKKTKHSAEYLGTEVALIVKWLEWNFDADMNWENHGSYWHIDHTLPINSFNLDVESDQMTCFNWKNMMPLSKQRNLKKADKILPLRIFHQEQRLRMFFKEQDIKEDLEIYIDAYSQVFHRVKSN